MIKIILVPVGGSERGLEVLRTAYTIAQRFTAHIKVVHVMESNFDPLYYAEIPVSLREQFTELNARMAGSTEGVVRKQFKDFCTQNKIKVTRGPSRSKVISASLNLYQGNTGNLLERESRLVDVIAMPRPEQRSGSVVFSDLQESLMLHSGRPVLLVPPGWDGHRTEHAAIGWNDSLEASRALALTLPWLVQMKKVTVLVSKKRAESGDDVVNYLKRHGCRAETHLLGRGRNVGKLMLEACDQAGVEFLVVGGFSHARARQRLFGGVTSYLLENANVITVMAH